MESTVSLVNTATGEILPAGEMDRWQWAEKIRTRYQDSAGAVLDLGKMLIEAKAQLEHGEFLAMIESDLPFKKSTAEMLMAIGRNLALGKSQHIGILPQSWGTLYELTRLPEPVLEELLSDGTITPETERQDVIRIRKALSAGAKHETPPLPVGTFSVVYADPPWAYDNSGFDQSAASQYPTMPLPEIAALPVSDLCNDQTVLFMWATSPLLPDAVAVIDAWGFEYKASMVWDKGRAPGMGWFVMTHHELLLIATRAGNPHPLERPVSVMRFTPGAHSAKPHEVYGIIESMYHGPYCELFARERREGWESFGNELPDA